MKYNHQVVIAVALVTLLICSVTIPATAQDPPPEPPANFYGDVVDEDGDPAPEGTTIVAVVNGSIEAEITVENAGEYGEESATGEKLSVNSGAGGEVLFYIDNTNGAQAVENPVALDQGTVELNLTFPTDAFESDNDDGTESDGDDDESDTGGGQSGGSVGSGSAQSNTESEETNFDNGSDDDTSVAENDSQEANSTQEDDDESTDEEDESSDSMLGLGMIATIIVLIAVTLLVRG
jgi:hypothetical protein